jgi:hypothetical protein
LMLRRSATNNAATLKAKVAAVCRHRTQPRGIAFALHRQYRAMAFNARAGGRVSEPFACVPRGSGGAAVVVRARVGPQATGAARVPSGHSGAHRRPSHRQLGAGPTPAAPCS